MDETVRHWLALSTLPGCGSMTLLKLLNVFLTPEALLMASETALCAAGASQSCIRRLKTPDWSVVERCLVWQAAATQRHILHWHDWRYPQLLRQIYAPPLVLFVCGDPLLLQQRQLAMVGARKPTHSGLEVAYQWSGELAQQQWVVTSGLAQGIDGASHQGCLNGVGQTIAVLGSGLNRIYPKCHTSLAQKIVQHGGALLSEFFPDTPPRAAHFPQRNRIISGLARGVVVIEAARQSGSLITAQYALEQGRDVFAMPGSIRNLLSQGCHALIKQGAILVEACKDILLELSFYQPYSSVIGSTGQSVHEEIQEYKLDSEDKKLVECLGFETTTVDSLIQQLGWPTDRILARLALLELQGHINVVPGGYVRK